MKNPKRKVTRCGECKGKKVVDWHYLDGEVKMEACPRCMGSGKEPKPQPVMDMPVHVKTVTGKMMSKDKLEAVMDTQAKCEHDYCVNNSLTGKIHCIECGKPKHTERVADWTSLEYNATVSHFANQIGIKLWQAMAMMKYANAKRTATEVQADIDHRRHQILLQWVAEKSMLYGHLLTEWWSAEGCRMFFEYAEKPGIKLIRERGSK